MKKYGTKYFINALPFLMALFSVLIFDASSFAASRGSGRNTPVAATRKTITTVATNTNTNTDANTGTNTSTTATVEDEVVDTIVETLNSEPLEDEYDEEDQILNKSDQFGAALFSMDSSSAALSKNDLAEQIRKQREAIEARENAEAVTISQKKALQSGRNACDTGLRKCMQDKCGSDFSKCALDGDTMFGDKMNLCRKDVQCTGEEFKLFTTEIKADRDMNARLSSYNNTVDCGNRYNDCIQKECGATFNKCLGKSAADRAIKNCETIAKNCMEQDSGLSSRVGTVIGRLRENAEQEVKVDEERMYTLRDMMSTQCKHLGAMFDERSFDCVYTVNFFAGEDQSTPMASRKAYAGNSFICMQEWFGTNVTTFMENAARETRAQKSASSAMLGSGVGTAAGLISSGAIGRAMDTQKAKKELKEEEKAQEADEKAAEKAEKDAEKAQKKEEKQQAKEQKKQEKQQAKEQKKQEKQQAKEKKKQEKQQAKAGKGKSK